MNANPDFFSRPYSPNAQGAFLRLVEDIGRTLEPTQNQLDTLERSYNSTGDFLVNCEEFRGQLEEIHPHGSRAIGTMTRPLRAKEGFDIDLVASLNRTAWAVYSGPGGATILLNRLHAAVTRYASQHSLKLHRWERCVTLEYADGMCADIAPVIEMPHHAAMHGETHGMIPDRELRGFHPTNPRGFTRLFGNIAAISPLFTATEALDEVFADVRKADIVPLPDPDVFGQLLCRLIQVMKLHKGIAFDKATLADLAPSSIFITALAANSYQAKARIPHRDQLGLLLDVIRTMPTMITRIPMGNGREEWHVENPTAPGDNFASSMNQPEKQQAFNQWHAQLLRDVTGLIHTIDQRQGLDQVARLVSSAFGDKAGAAMRQKENGRQSAARHAGRIATVTASGLVVPMTAQGHTFFGE